MELIFLTIACNSSLERLQKLLAVMFLSMLICGPILLNKALRMSMQESTQSDTSRVLEDQSFVSSILATVSSVCIELNSTCQHILRLSLCPISLTASWS